MKQAIIQLESLGCPSCLQKIESAVKRLHGIEAESVEVLFNSSRVRAHFHSESVSIESIEKAIEDLGYPVIRSRVKNASK